MANQSLISLPPNVEDPTVLRRVLSSIIVELDRVTGARALTMDSNYVSHKELNKSQEQLNNLISQVQSTLSQLNEENKVKSDSKIKKTNESINEVLTKVGNLSANISFEQNGSLSIRTSNNIDAVVSGNVATGQYRVDLSSTAINNGMSFNNAITIPTFYSTRTLMVQVNIVSSSRIDILVYNLTVSGSNVVKTATNLTSSERLDMLAIFNGAL